MSRLLYVPALALAALAARPLEAASLRYDMHPADLACPNASRFSDEVTAKLGFSPWHDDGQVIRVSIEAESGKYTGHLTSDRDHDRAFRADTCRRVADLLVTATAIALDRPDAMKPTAARPAPPTGGLYGNTPTRVATADGPPPRADELVLPSNPAVEWAFAARNNNFQLGIGMDSIVGTPMIAGAIPFLRGHFDVGIGHRGDSTMGSTVTMSMNEVMALYMWPVFYINKNSSFEVPIFAGGGAAYAWWSVSGNGSNNPSDNKIIPELAISESLQFRRLPVEFWFAMTIALADPPYGGSNEGVDLGLRYVFR